MKTKLALFTALVLLILLVGCHHQVVVQPPAAADHSITVNFNQSFANNGLCSTTVTTSCISGFDEGYVTGTLSTTTVPAPCTSTVTTNCANQLHTDTGAICSGSTQPEACTSTFSGILPIGSIVFYVVTTYVDQNGNAGETTPALSSAVPVVADTSTNVVVTVH